MISISRSLPALFCALALVIGTSPARAVVLTATAPIASPPVTVTSASPLPVVFDFGQSFASVTFAQFTLAFSGDLLDPDEMWFMSKAGGQVNLSGMSQSGAKLNVLAPTLLADLLDGTFSDNLTALDWYTISSFGLASISLLIDATPLSVFEPASLALFAAGLVGLVQVRRRHA
jgi:hypothetical protein